MSMLEKRLQLLAVADFDYLSARILLNSGIPFTGLPKAAEALEKLLKLFLILEAKIIHNVDLDTKTIKSYGHDLTKLLKTVTEKTPMNFGEEWFDYITELQHSYDKRYPDNWKTEITWVSDVTKLDIIYSYLRENIILNFPVEEKEKAEKFGSVLIEAYTENVCTVIEKNGYFPPLSALEMNNKSIENFNM